MPLDPDVRDLFAGANFVHLATLMPDGGPHSVAIWADVHDDEHVVFFTSPTSRKRATSTGTLVWRCRSSTGTTPTGPR
jgi:pyridoxine/pyridoxamine 5'-phosphate oxidase